MMRHHSRHPRVALIQWAAERNIRSFSLSGLAFLSSGTEHSVYRSAERVIKMTRPNKFGRSPKTEGISATPLEYLERLAGQNHFFFHDISILAVIGTVTTMQVVSGQRILLTEGQRSRLMKSSNSLSLGISSGTRGTEKRSFTTQQMSS
jgi:hypothetical protein